MPLGDSASISWRMFYVDQNAQEYNLDWWITSMNLNRTPDYMDLTGILNVPQSWVDNGYTILLKLTNNTLNGGTAGILQKASKISLLKMDAIVGQTGPMKYSVEGATGSTYSILSISDFKYIGVSGTTGIYLNESLAGEHVIIKDEKGNAASSNIRVYPYGSDKIDGATSALINTDYGALNIIKGTTGWWTI
jgi:hypothetical protein